MAVSNKNIVVVLVSVILAGGLGFVVGSKQKSKSPPLLDLEAQKAVPSPAANAQGDLEHKSVEELGASLSKIMLPDDEYTKLGDAIYQTAMSLLMAQAQGSGIEISEATEQELKDSIAKKYSRQYFSDMNANSMKELSKDDLVAILSFYNTEAGQKFLTLSPKIIENTMSSVQTDLSQWLPATVDALVAKLKGGKPAGAPPENPKVNDNTPPAGNEPLFKDKAELDS